MCPQTPDAVSTCRCFIPLLHRESHLLSDYCLFRIVLYSSQMPRATEHNTGHNRWTQRGAGSWQKGATHTYALQLHTQTYKCYANTAAHAHTHSEMPHTHFHGHKHTLTAAQRHKAGITMAGREDQTCIRAPMGFKGMHTHFIYTYTGIHTKTHTHKRA